MKKILLSLVLLASFSTFAAEVCDVNQSNFEDFYIRCSDINEAHSLTKKLKALNGNRNDVVLMKFMLDEGYEIAAARTEKFTDEETSMSWIFVKK